MYPVRKHVLITMYPVWNWKLVTNSYLLLLIDNHSEIIHIVTMHLVRIDLGVYLNFYTVNN